MENHEPGKIADGSGSPSLLSSSGPENKTNPYDIKRMETITDSKLNPERLFPADPKLRGVTRELYQEVKDLPLISPHGHTDPQWFASNQNFTNATELFLIRPLLRLEDED